MAKYQDTLSYKIGSGIGTLIFKCLFGAFILIWKGIIKSSVRYKPLIIVYIVLTIVSFVSVGEFRNWAVIYIDILCIVIFGINELRIEYPEKKKRKYFNAVFEKVNLKTVDDYVPYYMYENDISEFVTAFAFKTVITLNQWTSKKEQLEMYINEKILDIIQDKENNRIIYIFIQKQPLPSKIEWNDEYINDEENILNIGMDYYDIIGMDLKKYPHAFIAGETGCGKSNVLKCLIHQAIIKEYDVILIDFKRGVSFSEFSEYVTIYYDYQKTAQILIGLVDETKRRLDLFRDNKVDNLDDYNNKSGDYLYRTIIFIDELAELLKSRDKAIASILNDSIETLTRLSRATGIHLIMGMQRPDSTIISGQIKNNVSFRVCGRFVDKEPSRIMLGSDKASTLSNIKGRFIVKDDELYEVQAFYYDSDNIYEDEDIDDYMDFSEDDEIIEYNQEYNNNENVNNVNYKEVEKINQTENSNEIIFDFSDFKNK